MGLAKLVRFVMMGMKFVMSALELDTFLAGQTIEIRQIFFHNIIFCLLLFVNVKLFQRLKRN